MNENRAIVSDIAGTTRDTIEETLNINGIVFRLIDTAGIREHSTDVIELVGIEKSVEKMNAADIVLYIFDVEEMGPIDLKLITDQFDAIDKPYLLVGNKTDGANMQTLLNTYAEVEGVLFISARNQTGIDELKLQLFEHTVHQLPTSENVVITNARHHSALLQVYRSLEDIRNGLDQQVPGDLLALDIRRCLHYISEITGDISNEDVLDMIFSKFCIGK